MQNGFGSFGTFTKSSWNGLLSYDSYGILRARSKTSTWHRDTPGDLRWRRRIWQVCGRPYAAGQKMARLGARRAGSVELFLFLNVLLGADPFVWFVFNIYGITGPWYEIPMNGSHTKSQFHGFKMFQTGYWCLREGKELIMCNPCWIGKESQSLGMFNVHIF